MSYSVSQRTNELGIRIALGAATIDIVKLVITQGGRLVVAGLLIGLAGALTRLIESQLYEVSPTDPLVLIVISLLVLIVAFIACWIPARRAAGVDPMTALRYE